MQSSLTIRPVFRVYNGTGLDEKAHDRHIVGSARDDERHRQSVDVNALFQQALDGVVIAVCAGR
eukprot:1965073-Prymnesium_polylepis.1